MDKNKHMRRQAYLDDELLVEEVISLENEFTPQEKRQLQAERTLESCIVEKLDSNEQCPEALWNDIKTQLQAKQKKQRGNHFARVYNLHRFWRAAAAIILVTTVAVLAMREFYHQTSSLDIVFPQNVQSFAQTAQIKGGETEVNAFLANNNFKIPITMLDQTPHNLEIVGASIVDLHGKKVAKLSFTCCDFPIYVFITNKEIDLPDMSASGPYSTYHRISKKTDKYNIAAISPHNPKEVFNVF